MLRNGYTSVVHSLGLPQGLSRPALAPEPELADVFVWAVIDWHFRRQRPQHLASAMASKGHRVFYISNNFVDAPAAGFTVEALDETCRLFQVNLRVEGAPQIYDDLPTDAQVAAIRASLAKLLDWTQTLRSISLVQHPFWSPLIRAVPSARVVYDCMDHHGGFANNGPGIVVAEALLVRNADLLVVTSQWLHDEVVGQARATALVRNGCEFGFFRDAPGRTFKDAKARRVIGYYGAIADWFDTELVKLVALAHPHELVLLVGRDTAGAAARLDCIPNVLMLGEVPYADLPYYLHAFDVCILPFKVIPLTVATNPVKVYEYLAAGKAVVAVDLPELRQFEDLVQVASDSAGFVQAVTAALSGDEGRAGNARARQDFASQQTWCHRALELDRAIDAVKEPRVSVVVLTHNNLAFSQECLFSIEAYSEYSNLEVLVVDNASTDGTREWLETWQSEVSQAGHFRKVLLNEANLGFAAGNNRGLRAAQGEFIVVLNNDTYVTPGWVRSLCNHLRDDRRVGLVGPVTNNIGNEARVEAIYSSMEAMIRVAGEHTRRRPGSRFRMANAAFFCVAMRRDVYARVGDLDERFGMGFFEDDDYCRRVEQAGLEVYCAEDVFIHHHLSASFDSLGVEVKRALFEKNKALYEAKWGAWTPHVYRTGDKAMES